MHPADLTALLNFRASLDHAHRLALEALGDVLTDDRTSAVRLADMEAALQEIARVTDTTPLPDPLLSRLRAAVKEKKHG